MTDSELIRIGDNGVESSDGWSVSLVGADWIEYSTGEAACLVNVDYSAQYQARQVHASESRSELFPHLREHLRAALRLMQGRYVVV